jgi:hypothetical protein
MVCLHNWGTNSKFAWVGSIPEWAQMWMLTLDSGDPCMSKQTKGNRAHTNNLKTPKPIQCVQWRMKEDREDQWFLLSRVTRFNIDP